MKDLGLIPDALGTLVEAALEFRTLCGSGTLACFTRNLPTGDPRYAQQHLAFVAQRREISGLSRYPDEIIRTVLALRGVALTIRTLLARGPDHETAARIAIATGDLFLMRDRMPTECIPAETFAHAIAEHAIVTHADAERIWDALVHYLSAHAHGDTFLGMFIFATGDDVLLARSPLGNDVALATICVTEYDIAPASHQACA